MEIIVLLYHSVRTPIFRFENSIFLLFTRNYSNTIIKTKKITLRGFLKARDFQLNKKNALKILNTPNFILFN
jgi:hypothetical protein